MEAARQAARQLARQGDVVITQKGLVVDPDSFKGPIRLRLAAAGGTAERAVAADAPGARAGAASASCGGISAARNGPAGDGNSARTTPGGPGGRTSRTDKGGASSSLMSVTDSLKLLRQAQHQK
ncbi:hypothetical protein COO60DRAFT_1614902, partial [Scenedesmus sp. NREL 46B-D3]